MCLKNVPSLTGYRFNIHSPIFVFLHVTAHIQKLATVITSSTTSLLLTLFCSEVKLRHQRLEAASHGYAGKHSAEHHRQGRWSFHACMREGEWTSFWTSGVNNRIFLQFVCLCYCVLLRQSLDSHCMQSHSAWWWLAATALLQWQ